ncbi:hypothetical protein PF70_00952 [Pseudomonas asplenii]|nr:hypothetical protein PF70_00952 [Pseudomonas fuscovaginae]
MMSETFKYRDPILQSEGPIPVYYWLFREASPQDVFYIRDFLENFILAIAGETPYAKNFKNIEEYKHASRSINDKSSHNTRYDILKNNFLNWRMAN